MYAASQVSGYEVAPLSGANDSNVGCISLTVGTVGAVGAAEADCAPTSPAPASATAATAAIEALILMPTEITNPTASAHADAK